MGPFLQFRVWLRDTPGIELRAWTALGVVLCLLGIWAFAPEHDHGPRADRVEGAVAAGASRDGGGASPAAATGAGGTTNATDSASSPATTIANPGTGAAGQAGGAWHLIDP